MRNNSNLRELLSLADKCSTWGGVIDLTQKEICLENNCAGHSKGHLPFVHTRRDQRCTLSDVQWRAELDLEVKLHTLLHPLFSYPHPLLLLCWCLQVGTLLPSCWLIHQAKVIHMLIPSTSLCLHKFVLNRQITYSYPPCAHSIVGRVHYKKGLYINVLVSTFPYFLALWHALQLSFPILPTSFRMSARWDWAIVQWAIANYLKQLNTWPFTVAQSPGCC